MSQHDEHSEDMFEDTRMTFGEHLEELRLHMWKAIAGFLVAVFFSFFIGKYVLEAIAAPVESQLRKFYADRAKKVEDDLDSDPELQKLNQPIDVELSLPADQLAEQLLPEKEAKKLAGTLKDRRIEVMARLEQPLRFVVKMHGAQQVVARRPGLSTLSPQEAFMAYFKVCLGCGVVIGSPWIFYQLWLFVAAGLYPHEKRLVNVYLPFSLALFLTGVAICQIFVIPKALEALLWFNQWLGLEPDLRFNEWLSFAIMMPLVFGVSFQMPLAMLFLERIGIFTVQNYTSQWRIALFVIHIFAAIITPSVDIVSLELLALPMFGLYFLGILLCKLRPPAKPWDIDVPDSEEMMEV